MSRSSTTYRVVVVLGDCALVDAIMDSPAEEPSPVLGTCAAPGLADDAEMPVPVRLPYDLPRWDEPWGQPARGRIGPHPRPWVRPTAIGSNRSSRLCSTIAVPVTNRTVAHIMRIGKLAIAAVAA